MIKKVTILAILFILCLGTFAGCGEDKRNIKPEDFAGTWETTEWNVGDKPWDDKMTLVLNEDYTGKLTVGEKSQDITWETSGWYTDEDGTPPAIPPRAKLTLAENITTGTLTIETNKTFYLKYDETNKNFTFDTDWKQQTDLGEARFNTTGTLDRK